MTLYSIRPDHGSDMDHREREDDFFGDGFGDFVGHGGFDMHMEFGEAFETSHILCSYYKTVLDP